MTHDLTFATSCPALLEACGWQESDDDDGRWFNTWPYGPKYASELYPLSEATDADLDQLIGRGVRMLYELGYMPYRVDQRNGPVFAYYTKVPPYIVLDPNPLAAIVAALETTEPTP